MIVAIIQNNPTFKNIPHNLAQLTLQINKLSRTDLIIMPEMASTGYCFDGKDDVGLFVNDLTLNWAVDLAFKRSTILVIGVPTVKTLTSTTNESINTDASTPIIASPTADALNRKTYYNSLLVCFPDKSTKLYSKHHLYSQDEYWATPGDSFKSIQIKEFGKVALGICMDLNPYRFLAPFDAFEFANYHLDADWIWLCNAWLSSPDRPSEGPCVDTIKYWITRLYPLVRDKKTCNVVIANRVGSEGPSVFCGSSCFIQIKLGVVKVVAALGTGEGTLIVDSSLL